MNVNNFFQELFEDRLGLNVLGLENRYRELIEYINRTSLKTFSDHVRCIYPHYLDLDNPDIIITENYDRVGREVYIKDPMLDLFNLPIFDVLKITVTGVGQNDTSDEYYAGMYFPRETMNIDSLLMGSEGTFTQSLINASIPFTKYHELRGGRVLYLRNYPTSGKVEVQLRTSFPNISSIPDNYKEIFMNICKYDIKIKLYNELKYIEDVVTPSGNLNLKISDWDSADKDRDEYLKELKRTALSDRVGPMYFQVL